MPKGGFPGWPWGSKVAECGRTWRVSQKLSLSPQSATGASGRQTSPEGGRENTKNWKKLEKISPSKIKIPLPLTKKHAQLEKHFRLLN